MNNELEELIEETKKMRDALSVFAIVGFCVGCASLLVLLRFVSVCG